MPSNREWASVIWLGVLVAVALSKSDFRSMTSSVLRIAVQPIIVEAVLILLAYVATLITFGWLFDWWTPELTTDTVVWILGPAFGLLFGITDALSRPNFFRTGARRVFGWVAGVEFFLRLAVFSLWIELIIQPLVFFLVAISLVASRDQRSAPVKKTVDVTIALIGFGFIAYAAMHVASERAGLGDWGSLRAFVLPIWLTLGTLPLIYVLALSIEIGRAHV